MHSAEKVFFDRITKAYPTLSTKKNVWPILFWLITKRFLL